MANYTSIDDVVKTGKKYNIILADPPWSYKVWSNKGAGRSAESHYHTMEAQSIRNMPVKDIADKNAVLLMWVIYPCLEEGLELIKKATHHSLVWDIILEQIMRFVFWPLKENLYSVKVKLFVK